MNLPTAIAAETTTIQQDESFGQTEQETPTFGRTEIVHSGAAPEPQDPSATAFKLAQDLKNFESVASKIRSEMNIGETFEERCQQAFNICNDLFAHAPIWVCFFRETLAGGGMVRALFADEMEYADFLCTDAFSQIQQMLTALRSRDLPENDPNDPQRMITVRLPKSLHEALCDEAGRLNISINKLCISRMLQQLDPKMIPEPTTKPRGRKPRTREQAAS